MKRTKKPKRRTPKTRKERTIDRFEPSREDLTLHDVLGALADPVRLEIVRRLYNNVGLGGLESGAFADIANVTTASMASRHLSVLRKAGITAAKYEGKFRLVSLRLDDLDARWPGLVQVVDRVAGP